MKYPFRPAGALAALLVVAFASAAHAAAPRSRLADPADDGATVPPTRYESFDLAPPASVAPLAPSEQWKALNQVVAAYDSMSLTMDMEEATPAEGKVIAPSAAIAVPATLPAHVPDPAPAHAPSPDPHAHHQRKAVK